MVSNLLFSIWRKVICVKNAIGGFAIFKPLKNCPVDIEVSDHGGYLSIETCKLNGWYVMSGKSRITGGWTAWAKKTPMLREDPVSEPGEPLHFEFGRTREQAISRLISSMPNAEVTGGPLAARPVD